MTITAGGNNLRAGDLFRYCGAALRNQAAVPEREAAMAFAAAEIDSGKLAKEIASLIRSVRAAAPNARIMVTGYPYLDVRAAFAGHGINSASPWIHLDPASPAGPDNFHPNAAGYQAYYAALQNAGTYHQDTVPGKTCGPDPCAFR